MIEQRSREYIQDKVAFGTELNIDKHMLLRGLDYFRENRPIIHSKVKSSSSEHVFYAFAQDSINSDLDSDEVEVLIAGFEMHETYDEFIKSIFQIYQIKFDENAANWKSATCTCPSFYKKFICKHIIATAFKLKILNHDENDEPIEKKRKRGRPKLASQALIID